MRLVMALKVRNEEDILDHNLRYHAAQGVDAFIVTDNGSTDGTLDILRRWESAGRLRLISEPSAADFKEQGHWWVTRMARLAGSEMGADWVIHADADEFWWPPGGDLKQAFARVPEPFGVVVAPRTDFVARPESPAPFWERLTVREARSNLRPKLAHRPEPDVRLRRGAHDIDVEGEELARSGRPVLRNVRDREQDDDGRLVFANVFPARVMHLPLRSFDHYRRRVEVMLRGGFEDKARQRLRDAHEAGRLTEMYDELTYSDAVVEEGVREGRLVIDERLREFLPRCPDPTTDATAPAPLRPNENVEAELAELAFEGMRALTRAEQGLIRQREHLRRRLRRKERKLERADKTERSQRRASRLRNVTAALRRSDTEGS
jgi:hypothetical protein